jgi:hypothetical protein
MLDIASGTWPIIVGVVFTILLFLAYMLDRWFMRREERRWYNDIDIVGLYAHNDDRYGFKPVRNEEQLVMCGGCGHNIEPGACPGPENCPHFSSNKVAPFA